MCWFSSTAAPVGTANSANGPVHRYTNYEINWNHEDANFRGTITMQVNGAWYSASFGTLLANTIYHLCGTYNGSSLVAFKDGQLITTNSTMSGDQVLEPSSLCLCKHSTLAQYTSGTLYEARIYSRVLSNSEIADIYALKGQDTIYDSLHLRYLLSELAPGNTATGAGIIKNISNVSANGSPFNSPTYTEALYIQEHRRAC
jgi:hypothetical protein